jgi:hypothetical protein
MNKPSPPVRDLPVHEQYCISYSTPEKGLQATCECQVLHAVRGVHLDSRLGPRMHGSDWNHPDYTSLIILIRARARILAGGGRRWSCRRLVTWCMMRWNRVCTLLVAGQSFSTSIYSSPSEWNRIRAHFNLHCLLQFSCAACALSNHDDDARLFGLALACLGHVLHAVEVRISIRSLDHACTIRIETTQGLLGSMVLVLVLVLVFFTPN